MHHRNNAVDTFNHRIQKFTRKGKFISLWGTEGFGNGEFKFPGDISTNKDNGHVYVADTGNNRIQEFTRKGKYIRQWGAGGSGEGELATPYGIRLAMLPYRCRV